MGKLSDEQLTIIKNKELLAFHQDPTNGAPAMPFINDGNRLKSTPDFYAGRSEKGMHVFIVNTGWRAVHKQLNFAKVPGLFTSSATIVSVQDMWTGENLGVFQASLEVKLESHDTAAYLLVTS